MSDITNECYKCKYENSTDIKIAISKCSHCKRAYHMETERNTHEDLYEEVICKRLWNS